MSAAAPRGNVPCEFTKRQWKYWCVAVATAVIAGVFLVLALTAPLRGTAQVGVSGGILLLTAGIGVSLGGMFSHPRSFTVAGVSRVHEVPFAMWAVISNGREMPASRQKPLPSYLSEMPSAVVWRDMRPAMLALGILLSLLGAVTVVWSLNL